MMTSDVLVTAIQSKLIEQNKWLAVAESCTGGLVSDLITNTPGATKFFLGGVICYANEIKNNILAVKLQTMINFGAVSQQTVEEMSSGIRNLFCSTQHPKESIIGLAVTGISGPGGGTVDKPVGLVWISLESNRGKLSQHFQWHGSRQENKLETAEMALRMLLDHIE